MGGGESKILFTITDLKHTVQQIKKTCLVVTTVTKKSCRDIPQKSGKKYGLIF